MRKPTDRALHAARAEFRDLLSRATPESTWQAFFAANPFVLSRSLPLRLEPCDILPLGRPGRSEPDFVIYPGSNIAVPIHGIVELKTHSARVTTVTRKNVLSLTRDAATAIGQLRIYDRDYNLFSPIKRCTSFSSASHLFVVMGMWEEIADLYKRPDLIAQISDLFPPNVRLLCFDELLKTYEAGIPLRSFVLLPNATQRDRPTETGPEDFSTVGLRGRSKRSELHNRFGGSRQCGISLSPRSDNVFMFSRAASGEIHGYQDGWSDDGCFHYAGEGQRGDQRMACGNRAVLEAAGNGRVLRLFTSHGQDVEYQGRFELDSTLPYYQDTAPEIDGGPLRSVIIFRLRPVDTAHHLTGGNRVP
jgi:hypothetical protein